MSNVNLRELSKIISDKCKHIPLDDLMEVNTFLVDVLKEAMKNGKAVEIRGFGKFKPSKAPLCQNKIKYNFKSFTTKDE